MIVHEQRQQAGVLCCRKAENPQPGVLCNGVVAAICQLGALTSGTPVALRTNRAGGLQHRGCLEAQRAGKRLFARTSPPFYCYLTMTRAASSPRQSIVELTITPTTPRTASDSPTPNSYAPVAQPPRRSCHPCISGQSYNKKSATARQPRRHATA